MTAPFHVSLKGGLVDLCIIIRTHRLWIAEMGEVLKCILNHAGGVVCRQSDGGQGGWDADIGIQLCNCVAKIRAGFQTHGLTKTHIFLIG